MIDHEYHLKEEVLEKDKLYRYQISEMGSLLTFEEVLQKWKIDSQFRLLYTRWVLSSKFEKIYWEHPQLTEADLSKPYEFIIKKNETTNPLPPDQITFAKHFSKEKKVVNFLNLGRDAQLVVPCPLTPKDDYAHLVNFLRTGEHEQIQDFWMEVSETFSRELKKGKRWLSTCGMGVYWLHVRIDQRPKYYKYAPYRNA